MYTTYLDAKDWSEFEARFPSAAAFLAARTVRKEFQWLSRNQDVLTTWQTARLEELRQLFPPVTPCKYNKEAQEQPSVCQHPERVQEMMCHRQNCPWKERQHNDNCWDD